MSSFNLFNNHPIIPNANQYFMERKYVSIHSEDRDKTKFPNAAEFEIELPQDYLNIASVRLYSWSFPANYSVFSIENGNLSMAFSFKDLYNPGDHAYSDVLTEGIFAALYSNLSSEYIITIEPGFYTPNQIATELTNKMNDAVTNYIVAFFDANPAYAAAKALFVEYNRFVVVYNAVQMNLWFGNTADRFTLNNELVAKLNAEFADTTCIRKNVLPSSSDWGLPSYLGFGRCDVTALTASESVALERNAFKGIGYEFYYNTDVPRFYYGDVNNTGDNGYWLLPSLPGATVYFLRPPFKINVMGQAYMYMEIEGWNCLDETSPFKLSKFTSHTNETYGVVNSAFAKISIPTTPITQWFDADQTPYKYFNPPAERQRKIKLKIRYHDGKIVDFGTFEYSFMLEFTLLRNQQERTYSIRDAQNLGQLQS